MLQKYPESCGKAKVCLNTAYSISQKEDDAMEILTPSTVESKTMTAGQINKAVASYRALLEKHSREFDLTAVQSVLGQSELADEMFVVFRRRVEADSNMIVRRVRVNRNREPQEVIKATGRNQYVNDSVVACMPRGEGESTDVVFFTLGRYVSDDDLGKEYDLRGLKPADPYSLAAINEADPAFADGHPNGTHWKDSDDKWCFLAFNRWADGRRGVDVDRRGSGWRGVWWFAGARK